MHRLPSPTVHVYVLLTSAVLLASVLVLGVDSVKACHRQDLEQHCDLIKMSPLSFESFET